MLQKELSWTGEIWIAGFSDHRIRDDEDFEVHRRYIAKNPVEAELTERGEEYAYCSANGRFELDAFPRGLKPGSVGVVSGGAEAPPFQNNVDAFQNKNDAEIYGAHAVPFQNKGD